MVRVGAEVSSQGNFLLFLWELTSAPTRTTEFLLTDSESANEEFYKTWRLFFNSEYMKAFSNKNKRHNLINIVFLQQHGPYNLRI